MNTIGIDLGTTSICGIIADADTGKIKKVENRPNKSFIKTDNPWEKIQDAGKITETVFEVLDSLFGFESDIVSIGISNQMHGIIYLDKKAEPVSPLYIWQDERGNLPYKDGKTYAEYAGSFAGYGLVTDLYNRENGLVPENAEMCCTIGDYIAMKLCGTNRAVMHITNAASFGCFDILNNKFTVDNGMLPEVTDKFTVLGEYKGAKVCVAIGDNQASFMGAVNGDFPLVNVGTGSQISYLNDKPVKAENVETRPYDGEKYLIVGASLCGGRAFAMLERFFASVVEMATGSKPDSVYSEIDKMLEAGLETDMQADSRFCGTRANPDLRGSFYGISQENFTPKDMTVAILYAVAGELKGMYSGNTAKNIVCSGNGIRKNPALQKIVSKLFNAEILIPEFTEEASYGVALASLTAVGKYKTLSEAQKMIGYR